ncbi:variable large family protein [Borrelia coriaceae]|uniref:Variable large protein n=1 Tax=Borrelia coriaceae ATCC 43381 TaxID=1408429 RepID=W5SXL9_9SPIR|nr:variable large family protein [Borrelia coriaceae]AHH11655.1 Variable outer membrane protein [Borrelia coriaceae ATCC 43381]
MKINIKNIRLKSICATLFISLFFSCNNGIEELEKKNQFLSSLANLGNDFLSVFTSFGDTFGGVLGFNKDTKKSEVGAYFKKIHDTVQGTKDKLNQIVENMKREGNPNATGVETEVKKLISDVLDKIIDGAKTASGAIGSDSNLIANVAEQGAGGGVKEGDINSLFNGIKSIVDVVLKDSEGNPSAGTDKKSNALGARSTTEAGVLFSSSNAGTSDTAKNSAADAVKAVGAVTGADILQAMIKNKDTVTLAKNSEGNGNAASGKKDAVIAGGIVLRAMAKEGKFANASDSNDDYVTAVKDAAVSAVTKALNTLTIAIRKTINAGLKTVKDVIKINSSDTPITTEVGTFK